LTFNNAASGVTVVSGVGQYTLGALSDGGNGYALTLSDISGGAVNLTVGAGGGTGATLNPSTTYAGVLSGNGGLTKVGSGTMTLSGSNTYTGRTRVLAGEMDLDAAGGAGNYAITGDGANNAASSPDVFVNGGTLVTLANDQFNHTATIKVASGTVNFADTTQTLADLYNSGGTVDYSGTITFTDPTWAGGTNIVSGGTTTAGTLNVSGGSNYVEGTSYSDGAGLLAAGSVGGVNFSGAGSPNITLESDNGTPGILQLTGNVTADGASTATITSGNDNGGGGSNPGEVDLNGANRTFTVSGTTNPGLLISAQIVDSGTGGAITKAGTGIMTVTGANTYDGGTTVSSGILYVDNTTGSSGTGTGGVTVSGGTLAGNGFIQPGATATTGVSVTSGGTLASGNITFISGTPNTLTTGASSGITLDNTQANLGTATSNSILSVDGTSTAAALTFALSANTNGSAGPNSFSNPSLNSTYMTVLGSTAGEISFTGTNTAVNLVDLTPSATLTLREGVPFVLIQAQTGGVSVGDDAYYSGLVTSANGTLNDLMMDGNGYVIGVLEAPGDSLTQGTMDNISAITINQFGPDGVTALVADSTVYPDARLYLYDGDLEVVPEPGTWALMIGGLAVLVFIQRRRNKQS
jgi:autotransporter-associated beta strand protein